MSLKIETRSLSKSFGSFEAVSNVSLNLEPGLVHAVLGENGAGKSTLMKLLFGLHAPTSGEILLNGEAVRWQGPMDAIHRGLGMVQQHFTLVDALSAIDNIMLGAETMNRWGRLDRQRAIGKLESMLPDQSLCVPWKTPVASLTVGERQRVEVLKLIYRDAQVLFLDEPTAVLAPQEIDAFFAVLKRLQASGRTVVLITHKINEVFQICERYSVLRAGRLVAQGRVADSTPESIVESMIGRKPHAPSVARERPSDRMSFSCRDLVERGSARGGARGLSLDVHAGEIVGVAGVEGSGQGSLIEALMGLQDFAGEVFVCGEPVDANAIGRARELGCGLVPEDRHTQAIWGDESVRNNMIMGLEHDFVSRGSIDRARVRDKTDLWAREFDVRAASLDAPIASLSGGNQQKAVFAREIAGRQPRLLVCHQPTRGVDLGASEAIHARILTLRNQGVGVLYMSSELDELMALADRLYVMFEGRVAAEFVRSEFDRLRIGAAMTGALHG